MIAALLGGDEGAVQYVFYDHFRPLLNANASKVAHRKGVETDDLIQELYLYLSADNWSRLRRYNSEIPFVKWFSVVSYRFFKDFVRSMIDEAEKVPMYDMNGNPVSDNMSVNTEGSLMMDLLRLLPWFKPPREGEILKSLLVDDEEPEEVAKRHGVTVDNLYNIKRRALSKLIKNYLTGYKA